MSEEKKKDKERRDTISKDFWQDPQPKIRGILLSDMIQYYQKKTRMIGRYSEKCLEAASYQLRLGAIYYQNGERGELSEVNPHLRLPPNSLTYVSSFEEIHLPYYIVARFNLKVKLIYKGILLGTGPQVDPGFRGKLSCPLYNISSNEVFLKYKQAFAIIDFIKSTPFPSVKRFDKTLEKEKRLTSISGFDGNPCVIFEKEKWGRTLDDYIKERPNISSSIKRIDDDVQSMRERLLRFQWVTAGTAALIVLGIITYLALVMGNVTNAALECEKKSLENIKIEREYFDEQDSINLYYDKKIKGIEKHIYIE